MRDLWKNIFYGLLIFLFFAGVFSLLNPQEKIQEISFSEFIKQVEEKEVKTIEVKGNQIIIELKDGVKKTTTKETGSNLEEVLISYGIKSDDLKEINIVYREVENDFWIWLLISVLPVIFIGVFLWWILRQGQRGATQAFSFSKARPRIYGVGGKIREKVSFDDVADLKEAKEELKEVVEFLREPKKFLEMGARIPRGVLLVGPPGCGKTLLARAVASEASVPFFSISGSEFVEMFVGVGAARVRDLFSLAKKNAPCILFLDELDAVGRLRGAGLGGGHDEREQTLNQILVEMDGFERETNVILLAATNRPDILDPALLRPGRFDRHVVLDRPDIEGREEILKIHSKEKSLAKEVNFREIAERTPGFSGADLANLMNEAAILAARRNKKEITQDELRESIEKVLLGPERKSHVLSQKEKEVTAYHEAGHAILASFMPESEPVQKISIIARGLAAGYTLKLPTEERHLKTKTQFLAELATLLGGYTAEGMTFHQVTTGASNDLRQATDLARKLVMEYGMSKLGPIAFGEKTELIFLGKEFGEQRNFSEKIAAEIDKEVERFIKEAEKKAQKVLNERKDLLKKIAKLLIKKETIERQEFEKIIKEYKEKNKKGQKR
ncbi:MAG: cell division protein FtsH [Parcubacteria group bacterium CG_4_9_14_0_2_um_filter_35_11]|nr:MAG: cell division protein FtsH [Parcubacteria group bacterium CG_4_9_14_0_2_um_filter_35_11]